MLIDNWFVTNPKRPASFLRQIGREVTKNPSISHYHSAGFFLLLTFLKRGIFTLVKILFHTIPQLFTVAPSLRVRFFYFTQKVHKRDGSFCVLFECTPESLLCTARLLTIRT